MKLKKRWISLLMIFMMCWIAVLAHAETVQGNLAERFSDEYYEYDGVRYRQKKRLTTVLLMGIDKTGDEETTGYRHGGQADFQIVAVIDENRQTISLIQIDRDTMTNIDILNPLGQENGEMTAQICLAFGFGDGGQKSGELACKAVSRYLNDIPVDLYYALNLEGISVFNDMLGGVEVTLEDDFSVYDPQMMPGTTLTLNGQQAEYYLRYRYYVGDESNASRQKRQQVYMNAAKVILAEKVAASSAFAADMLDALSPYVVTNMNRGRIINLANKVDRYSVSDVWNIEGERAVGEDGFVEFHPDQDSLMNVILNVFYEKQE